MHGNFGRAGINWIKNIGMLKLILFAILSVLTTNGKKEL